MAEREEGDKSGSPSTMPDSVELLDLLKQAVQEVFTTMVFNFCEAVVRSGGDGPVVEVEGSDGGRERIAVDCEALVDFHGELDGSVVLRCSTEGAMDIARGLLMMDEGEALEMEEVADALGECANMVTGSLKTKGLDPHGEFLMGTPRVMDSPGERAGHHRGSLAYRLTQGLISVEIWIAD